MGSLGHAFIQQQKLKYHVQISFQIIVYYEKENT